MTFTSTEAPALHYCSPQLAYKGVAQITWADAYYRTDIGYRAVEREKAAK